ncbi:hypothetical protein O6H91_Y074200 [Diphasiastrum complanatum]|nr:hypothetical protein O6H91_Y074200 [Diphasiastrum complanatum]
MAEEFHSDGESDGQWDVVSMSATSDPEADHSVVGREDISVAEVHSNHFPCPTSPAAAPLVDFRGDRSRLWGEGELLPLQVQEDYVAASQELRPPFDSSNLQVEKHAAEKANPIVCVPGLSSDFHGMEAFLSPTQNEEVSEEGRDCRLILPPALSCAIGGAMLQVSKHTGLRLELPFNLEEEYIKTNPLDQRHHKDVDEFVRRIVEDKEKLNCQVVSEEVGIAAEQGALLIKCNSSEKLNCEKGVNLVAGPSLTNEHECEAWCMRQVQIWRAQARHINPFWSIALAAALMGLLILGQKWQQERHQNQQLQVQLCAKDEVQHVHFLSMCSSSCLHD